MSEDIKLNPVWVRYCSNRMEDWLSWARKVHIRSYIELTERFIDLHPHYIPSGKESNLVILDKMLMDRDFVPASVICYKNLFSIFKAKFMNYYIEDVYTYYIRM